MHIFRYKVDQSVISLCQCILTTQFLSFVVKTIQHPNETTKPEFNQ